MSDLPLYLDQIDSFTLEEELKKSKQANILLLPLGSVEPHGPHLPLATDRLISLYHAELSCQRLRDEGLNTWIAPAIAYGVTDFANGFCGAISISKSVFKALLKEICLSYFKLFDHICLVNHHLEPGQLEALVEVKQELQESLGLHKITFPMVTSKRWGKKLGEEFRSGACHAGSYEGSLVVVPYPTLVNLEKSQALDTLDISLSKAILEHKHSFKEIGMNLAYTGNPKAISHTLGQQLYEVLTDMLVTEIKEARLVAADIEDKAHDKVDH
jgi:creatinine amidohydrolase